ncbi:PDZ domain-containing protein 9 isoform X3 [Lathamus discolor]|uniref:PDZ domain-containing protein 9 isoform X3 n=1 Tax=Lathamus discolor TaxID=678569 RepID=UPI0032B7E032
MNYAVNVRNPPNSGHNNSVPLTEFIIPMPEWQCQFSRPHIYSITLQKPSGQLSELFTSPWSSNILPKGSPRTLRHYFGFEGKDLPQDLMEHTQSLQEPGDETMRDVLIKIGHATILGWTLQQLRQLLHNIPIGTTLQIRVYRDFVAVPQDWQSAIELIPEVKLPVVSVDTDYDEDGIGSSTDDDDAGL